MTALCALALAGCEAIHTAAQSKTVQGAAVGSALGAGTGAIIGNQTGRTWAGTAIGAGLGAVGGGLVGSAMEVQGKPKMPLASTSTSSAALTKFCPVDGEGYTASVKYCPTHGTELKDKEW